jgi:hypothetical protein
MYASEQPQSATQGYLLICQFQQDGLEMHAILYKRWKVLT